jgi:hypothetical protein
MSKESNIDMRIHQKRYLTFFGEYQSRVNFWYRITFPKVAAFSGEAGSLRNSGAADCADFEMEIK